VLNCGQSVKVVQEPCMFATKLHSLFMCVCAETLCKMSGLRLSQIREKVTPARKEQKHSQRPVCI